MNVIANEKPRQYVRTQATYPTSALYPEPLTPEFVNSGPANREPKNGQSPAPFNRWSPFDAIYYTNNWFHKDNDEAPLKLFNHNVTRGGLALQPVRNSLWYSTRSYDDNIPAQVIGALVGPGLQLGAVFGMIHTYNTAHEANIFQCIAMPPNRWLPLSKATPSFRAKIFATCVLQSMTFFGAYALVDGVMSQTRQKDDLFNPLGGGFASGVVLSSWFKTPLHTIPLGLCFGAFMGWMRFFVLKDDTPKLAFSFDRPLYGVIGGLDAWLGQREPQEGKFFAQLWSKKYRDWTL